MGPLSSTLSFHRLSTPEPVPLPSENLALSRILSLAFWVGLVFLHLVSALQTGMFLPCIFCGFPLISVAARDVNSY